MTNTLDITGQIFGALTAIERVGRSKRGILWRCACACGSYYCVKFIDVPTSVLRSGNTTSCLFRQYDKTIHTAIRNMFAVYKHKALCRNYVFILTLVEFHALIKKPCYYCGDNSDIKRMTRNKQVYRLRANGVDRKDNNLGYTLENCVACCEWCNRAKDILTPIDYIQHCKQVVNYNLGENNE